MTASKDWPELLPGGADPEPQQPAEETDRELDLESLTVDDLLLPGTERAEAPAEGWPAAPAEDHQREPAESWPAAPAEEYPQDTPVEAYEPEAPVEEDPPAGPRRSRRRASLRAQVDADQHRKPGRIGQILKAALGLFALGVAIYLVYDWYASGTAGKEIPMLRASDSPVKVKPESPGGLEVPYQDQLVLNQEGSGAEDEPVVEHLLPPPEAPQPPAVELEAMEPAETPVAPEPEVTDTISPRLPVFEAPAPDSRDLIEAPAPRMETMDEAVAEEPAPAAPGTVVAGLQAPAKGSYVVQLGSFTSRAATKRAWQLYQTAHPQLLSNMALFIQEAVVNGRTYYRVQSGSFPNRATAMDLCAQLKAKRQDCLVVRR